MLKVARRARALLTGGSLWTIADEISSAQGTWNLLGPRYGYFTRIVPAAQKQKPGT